MPRPIPLLVMMALASLLGACASSGPRGTEVTRYHLDETIPPQPVALEPVDPNDRGSLAFRNNADAVGRELARLGYTPGGDDTTELVALVKVSRDTRQEMPKRSPFSIGIGGGGSNVGVGTTMGVGGSSGKTVTVTTLELRLESRSRRQVLWEATAVNQAEPGADTATTALIEKMAAAALRGFPGKSGETYTVP